MTRKKTNWPRKNLGELLGFIDRQYPDGYGLADIESVTGICRQHLSQMMQRDNMKLSMAAKIVSAYGCSLSLFFPVRERCGLDYSTYREQRFDGAGLLAGLAKYIYDSRRSVHSVCSGIGISSGVLLRAFRSGDISIATLYAVTGYLHIEMLWHFDRRR